MATGSNLARALLSLSVVVVIVKRCITSLSTYTNELQGTPHRCDVSQCLTGDKRAVTISIVFQEADPVGPIGLRVPVRTSSAPRCRTALPYRAALEASRDGGVRMLNRRTFAPIQIARMTRAA